MKRSFTVVVERDPESHWLVGEVVELPGCYTQGPDFPTLESNIRGSQVIVRPLLRKIPGDIGLSPDDYNRMLTEI